MSGLSSAAEHHPSTDDDYEDFSSSVTESSSLCSPSGIGQSTCHAPPHLFLFIISHYTVKWLHSVSDVEGLSAVTMETPRHPSLLCLQVLTVASSGPADPEILPPGGAGWSGEATEAV